MGKSLIRLIPMQPLYTMHGTPTWIWALFCHFEDGNIRHKAAKICMTVPCAYRSLIQTQSTKASVIRIDAPASLLTLTAELPMSILSTQPSENRQDTSQEQLSSACVQPIIVCMYLVGVRGPPDMTQLNL